MKKLLSLLLLTTFVLGFGAGSAAAKKPKKKRDKVETTDVGGGQKATSRDGTTGENAVKVIDFTGLALSGRIRTPQLLYFLNRIRQELEAASLEKRSFLPELRSSVNDDAL